MSSNQWNFDNTYLTLPDDLYTREQLHLVSKPEIVVKNIQLAHDLGLDIAIFDSQEIFAGNSLPEGAEPIAQAYAGHQFGHFSILGDGRALLLGEHVTPDNERFDIQLKGSGRTPYSRMGDGRSPLAPMLREYIISEAMHALAIPTTRSLAVATTGEQVRREVTLPGAVLTRVAASHIRVGTFEYAVRLEDSEVIQALADYTINRHYPELNREENKYLALLDKVIDQQAALIAKWQAVGFIHGVMNTDNMAISGETIDYGPCAFMDAFNPGTVFSSIDVQGRYQYQNQPAIGLWNLSRFAETLVTLIDRDEAKALEHAQQALQQYEKLYMNYYLTEMGRKLGIHSIAEDDDQLVIDLLTLMEEHELDYTGTLRTLAENKVENITIRNEQAFTDWYQRWQKRIRTEDRPYELMKSVNPVVIPRNHLVEEALQDAAEHNDYTQFNKLVEVVTDPYNEAHAEKYLCGPEPEEQVFQTFCGT
ncbi:YdiU family protein [Macrococcus equipercicus]|uniref:Protein nucleotidyltransferase YdiU n=1 Tax=Macrococcus equipercicus TaxID=69967 RepID=A0ABQ6R8W7_9STAP|nr:YdiU family protein [Macrococcus equipercicus]KAA1039590.1 YdiU family protein [Macrococcus equipercicus]